MPTDCEECHARYPDASRDTFHPCRTRCWRERLDHDTLALAECAQLVLRGERIPRADGGHDDVWQADSGMLSILLAHPTQPLAQLLSTYDSGEVVEMLVRVAAERSSISYSDIEEWLDGAD